MRDKDGDTAILTMTQECVKNQAEHVETLQKHIEKLATEIQSQLEALDTNKSKLKELEASQDPKIKKEIKRLKEQRDTIIEKANAELEEYAANSGYLKEDLEQAKKAVNESGNYYLLDDATADGQADKKSGKVEKDGSTPTLNFNF